MLKKLLGVSLVWLLVSSFSCENGDMAEEILLPNSDESPNEGLAIPFGGGPLHYTRVDEGVDNADAFTGVLFSYDNLIEHFGLADLVATEGDVYHVKVRARGWAVLGDNNPFVNPLVEILVNGSVIDSLDNQNWSGDGIFHTYEYDFKVPWLSVVDVNSMTVRFTSQANNWFYGGFGDQLTGISLDAIDAIVQVVTEKGVDSVACTEKSMDLVACNEKVVPDTP